MRRFLLLALITGLANASEYGNSPPPGADKGAGTTFSRLLKETPLPVPEEQEFTKPDPAKIGKWQEFIANYDSKMNQFYLALDSISVGEDKIVRYAVAVTTKNSDVRNVSYEGLDCKTKQYRGYAYLSGDKWQNLNRKWEVIVKNKRNGYQGKLLKEFCWGGEPSTVPKIVDSMTSNEPIKMVH
jgi:hypothetical protein